MLKSKVGRSKGGNVSSKYRQGDTLPPPGTLLRYFPVGCCVKFQAGPGVSSPTWFMVVYRIGGGVGNPHCRTMSNPPTDLGWQVGMSEESCADGDAVVAESCWPKRASDSSRDVTEQDPLVLGLRESRHTAEDVQQTEIASE